MPRLNFVDLKGDEHQVEASVGQSVMQSAISNLIPDVQSECGGNCACASCHAYVDEAWVDRLVLPAQHELDMLTCVQKLQPNSRLTCQIKMTQDLDGLVIHIVDNEF